MLMHPYLNAPYNPSLGHFLGGFDIYDREESLGVELSAYDPDCPLDRGSLISRFIVRRFAGLSYRHKFVLVFVLGEALDGDSSVFPEIFAHDPMAHSLLPIGWSEMIDPKAFFEDVYIKLSEAWHDDLYKASQEDFSNW
ncbi:MULTISPECIES: hypothetical protein [Pseudomonas]|uniref:Uncharacterized protein n=1 Tax=Pseudomonas nunensis TaxID=2961896 RepID=A0ABY5EGH1_9PSED|nr:MULTISPECIES: hypothetical protein [Pseudomonas]KPN89044.1 hypothetical protein AL066_23345 [Pseudomonas nunensis]MCL5226740.1 hypothetical protein [Pseudomonas nunensis]UTO13372.1 hypothetical protein NK667_24865 [Pseudomonas nunensis]UZE12471.1 hypothetical protein LOY68_02335 [Pseudomonas sp. B21-053]